MDIYKNLNNLILLIFTAFIISFSTGCVVGPDFEPPEIDTPQTYRFSENEIDEIVTLEWWKLFNDPVLVELVNTALKNNKDVLIALSRVEEARANLKFVGADRFPTIEAEGAANRANFAGGNILDDTLDTAFITGIVNWEIDFWGKFRRATESAKADFIATEYAAKSIQISLISDVVSTYFILLDFHQRLTIAQQTLEARDKTLNIIQKRFDRGVVSKIDLNQALIQREIAATAIPQNERFVATTEDSLSILLGEFPKEIKTTGDIYSQAIPPKIPVGVPSSLLERRPDIIEAYYRAKSQNAQIGVAQALRLPSINLSGSVGGAVNEVNSNSIEDLVWSFGGGLFWPIFNFGKNEARVEIEEARTVQARLQYEKVVLNAVREVADSINEIETYKKEIEALEVQTETARVANRLSNLRYDNGVTSYLEVLDSEEQLFNVSLQLSETTREYYNSYVRLYKALGGGWITEEEKPKE